MAQFIPPADLDFTAYKNSLKAFLKSQDRFKDYDFEGSNLSVLIDILSYNAYNQAHYLNMVGSEMFLDTSILRESIVSHAKELNYTPRSRVSARARVSVEIVPNGLPSSVTIPKNYGFKTSSSQSNAIKFLTDQPLIARKDANNRYIVDDVDIFEGNIVTERFTVVATSSQNGSVIYNQRFILQSENIDVSSIEVTIQADSNDNMPTTYERATTLYGLTNLSQIFFVRGYKSNHYEIEFGDNVLGAALLAGNIVTVSYRDTIGEEGNGSFVFTKTGTIDGSSSITVTTLTRATGGAERESDDSIKYNAVRHFQVQERAVNESDFDILIRENFPEIQQCNVYGGEKVAQYGKVMIALKPFNVEGIVEESTKSRIIEFLKTKTLVPEPVILDPEYYYVGITGNVYYNVNQTTLRENQILTNIHNALLALNNKELGDFNTIASQSLIATTIADSNPMITAVDVKLSMVKRWFPERGVAKTFTFTTDNTIQSSNEGAYTNTINYGVTSSVFQKIVSDQITNCIIRDNGIGTLYLYVISLDGKLVKVVEPVGTVNYVTGEVSFVLDVYDYTPYIAFTCVLGSNSIVISKDKFISVDTPHIALKLIK